MSPRASGPGMARPNTSRTPRHLDRPASSAGGMFPTACTLVACGIPTRSSIRSNRPAEEIRNDGAGSAPMARRVAGPDPGIPPDGVSRPRREADRAHPENPRYFLFEGKPTFLITSGEHYGAVLNLDFDFVPYLDELHSRGFNLTRTFSGTYREVPGSFKIAAQHPGPGARAVRRPLGPVGDARGGRRREQVRPRRAGTRPTSAASRRSAPRPRSAGSSSSSSCSAPSTRRRSGTANPMNAPEQRQRRRARCPATRSSR